ncbi:MAG: 4-hydroxy-tetrahydrodipicolinate reductase [bacterium]|nr:4-hydroxy-tetrahydrodipicolinate reductase [bacterium]
MSRTHVVALFGAAGRMGREILRLAPRFEQLRLTHAYDTAHVGEKVESLTIEAPPSVLPEDVRAILDFSAAPMVLDHLELAVRAGAAYVCGVTGLSQDVMNKLRASGNEIPVLHSPNMAVGMNLMFHLSALAAKALPDYARHIEETHHAAKKDSPSGTALRLRDSIENATGEDTEITALRMGDVIGEHRLIFGGPGERLEITHKADSRAVFAVGALRVAAWVLEHRSAGFYTMSDVLGL